MNPITLTILADNHAREGFISEHGLSVLIEKDGTRILFDTGNGDALFINAEKLGVSLTDLSTVVLSHGHYDHGGNLAEILRINPQAVLYLHPSAMDIRYSIHADRPVAKISLSNEARNAILAHPQINIRWDHKNREVAPGLFSTGPIPRTLSFEDTGGPFFLDPKGLRPDLIPDDQALWFNTNNGVVVVCGCCHAGLINTLEYIDELNNHSPLHAIVGGFHLLHASSQRLEKTVTFLNEQAPDWIIPLHCTGETAVPYLIDHCHSEVVETGAGAVFTF